MSLTLDGSPLPFPGYRRGMVFETVGGGGGEQWVFVHVDGLGFRIKWNKKVRRRNLCMQRLPY